MILLDTNVVSEAMTREPHPRVRRWLDAQVAETLFLSSVTVAELLFGIGALPTGKRKEHLAAALDDVLDLFADRVLPFDAVAARRYADLAGARLGLSCPTVATLGAHSHFAPQPLRPMHPADLAGFT
jgi:hypothetical protein